MGFSSWFVWDILGILPAILNFGGSEIRIMCNSFVFPQYLVISKNLWTFVSRVLLPSMIFHAVEELFCCASPSDVIGLEHRPCLLTPPHGLEWSVSVSVLRNGI